MLKLLFKVGTRYENEKCCIGCWESYYLNKSGPSFTINICKRIFMSSGVISKVGYYLKAYFFTIHLLSHSSSLHSFRSAGDAASTRFPTRT